MISGRLTLAGLIGLVLAPLASGAQVPAGTGLLLPVRDRPGDPAIAGSVSDQLLRDLDGRGEVLEADQFRAFLRHLRIRDLERAAPRQLNRLATELGVSWFLAPTLLEASAGEIPRVSVSASLYRKDSRELGRVNFSAASGTDGLPWLGLGGVDEVDELAGIVAERLVRTLLRDPSTEARSNSRRRAAGGSLPGKIAVIPFNAVTDRDPGGAAAAATHAALAALQGHGATLVFPGLVEHIQRGQGKTWRGEVDDATSIALREQAGADWIFTGTVEVFDLGAGPRPEPRVALGARLIFAADNRLAWTGGRDWSGRDREHLFGAGRIYSSGVLLQGIMDDLVTEAGNVADGYPGG